MSNVFSGASRLNIKRDVMKGLRSQNIVFRFVKGRACYECHKVLSLRSSSIVHVPRDAFSTSVINSIIAVSKYQM